MFRNILFLISQKNKTRFGRTYLDGYDRCTFLSILCTEDGYVMMEMYSGIYIMYRGRYVMMEMYSAIYIMYRGRVRYDGDVLCYLYYVQGTGTI